jgi:hypothetical protein
MGEPGKAAPALKMAAALLPLALLGAGAWHYLHRGAQSPGPAPAEGPAFSATSGGAAAPQAPAVEPPGAPMPSASLEIKGSQVFRARVTAALKLIWEADRETFVFLRNNLSVIRNGNSTGFYSEEGRPAAVLSSAHAFRSETWCAGIIAHQAWHASYEKNFKKKKPSGPPPPPGSDAKPAFRINMRNHDYRDMGMLLEMEDRASRYQLEVLRKVGAPRSETDEVFRRAPRDFSTAHDGAYHLRP